MQQLISKEEIQQKIAQVCRRLEEEYRGEEIVIVMVMKGALCLAADLIRELHLPASIEYVQAKSYGAKGTHRGELTLFGLGGLDLRGKHVLLIDDILDSGVTLSAIAKHLREHSPKSFKSLVLLSKRVKRTEPFFADYVLFEIENQFVVGYGLDHKELLRGLPGVYIYTEGSAP